MVARALKNIMGVLIERIKNLFEWGKKL